MATDLQATMSDALVRWHTSVGAAADEKLASPDRLKASEDWGGCIDRLLSWLGTPEQLDYEEVEPPEPDVISSAIDFAFDARREQQPAPTSVGPTVDGGVAFEWRADGEFQQVEVCGIGVAEVTGIREGRVVAHFWLERDPRHRGWLIRGDAGD